MSSVISQIANSSLLLWTVLGAIAAAIVAGPLGQRMGTSWLGTFLALASLFEIVVNRRYPPEERFEEVVAAINAHPEVAHNYERAHALNVWFVLATDRPERIDEVLTDIKGETGLEVYAFPKLEEFFIGLRIEA